MYVPIQDDTSCSWVDFLLPGCSLSSWGRETRGRSAVKLRMAVKFGICLSLAALALPVSVDDGLFGLLVGKRRCAGRGGVGWISKAELEQIGILGLELLKKEKRGRD